MPTLEDWFERTYGVRGATLSETCQLLTTNSDGPYQATGTPKSWDHKYIAEDVPVGLMPMRALAEAAGVPMPGDRRGDPPRRDPRRHAISPAPRAPSHRMGLAGMDAARIKRVLAEGF